MTHHAFSFLKLPPFPPKPRKSGLFIGSDHGLPLGALQDLLETCSDIIDYAKLADHAGLASRYSTEWLKKKVALYHRYDVATFIGGITFELAALQGKVDEYFNRVKELGFSGVEISYDSIPEAPRKERLALIKKAKALGLRVFTEVGRKFPDKPLEASETIESIKADLEAGAHSVSIEGAETAVLRNTNPKFVSDVAKAIGLEKIVFECSPPYPWTDVAVWLTKTVSPDVNLENIPLPETFKAYGIRRGMTRESGYWFMTGKGAKI